jgi:phosphoglycolate phosphatase-like HAD superfamily hydrolase
MIQVHEALQRFQPRHRFLVGIDSDGCAFDTMEVKHKECFIPNTINEWDLQAVSKYAREAAEFVNLYSKWRGINRFPALLMTFDLLAQRPEVLKRGVQIPPVANLRQWVKTETKLANPALEAAAQKTGHPDLAQALRWSRAVNASVERTVRGVPPFPFLRESLEKLATVADIIVVSATPGEALEREWKEHCIAPFAAVIAGQELGTKKQLLGWANAGRYGRDHVLMVGDAPGDLDAARANGALFYPINPSAEDASWERFCEQAFGRFIEGRYAGEYEAALIAEFDRYLPEEPPWKLRSGSGR